MAIGTRATKDFQIFLAGWSARQRLDDIRKEIITTPNVLEASREFLDWKIRVSKAKQKRGLASMTPEKRQAIARLGGLAVQAQGKGHKWTESEAKAAGRLGGLSKQKGTK